MGHTYLMRTCSRQLKTGQYLDSGSHRPLHCADNRCATSNSLKYLSALLSQLNTVILELSRTRRHHLCCGVQSSLRFGHLCSQLNE